VIQLGRSVRSRRKQLGLTLKEVSDLSQLSVGFLSQVERNLTAPSLSSLVNIAAALNVEMDYFLAQPDGAGLVSRKSERGYFSVEGSMVQYARVTKDFPGSQIHGVIMKVPPHFEAEQNQHYGEDMLYVISGRCWLRIGGQIHHLESGDTIHFQAGKPHCYGNDSDTECVLLSLNTLQLFTRHEK
jgi:quercetin dioxygenase-like cupin family protein